MFWILIHLTYRLTVLMKARFHLTMVSTHRQYGPRVTYQMHHFVPSGTESAYSFPSSTQKRVGLWCQSWVATWVETTWHVWTCMMMLLQTSWSSPLALERWELRKVWYNASIYHRTWHKLLHAMLAFGGIHKNTNPTGSLPLLRREVHEQMKCRMPFHPPTQPLT